MATKQYDIIFAGAGTAACVAAGRLAAADPSLKILLVEAGPHTHGLDAHVQPYRYVSNLAPGSTTIGAYVSPPSPAVGDRPIVIVTGQCVGGASAINFMMYTRACASDYDDWNAPGWSAEELLPLLKKTETYQEAPDQPTHGYDGPLKVSHGGHFTNVAQQFLDVAAKYDTERGAIDDLNALYECDGYGRWAKWIDKETGQRSDPARQYIYNQTGNSNLEIMANARVVRVLFEGDRASGVEYVADDANSSGTRQVVHASRLVVLSAGAFGTPAILERSGIGSARVLEKVGVPVRVDLPGVGENYQDHHCMFIPYHAADDAETLDGLWRGEPEETAHWQKIYDEEGKGLMAHNGVDAGIKLRPTPAERAQMGPAFQDTHPGLGAQDMQPGEGTEAHGASPLTHWDATFARAPDRPVMALGCLSGLVGVDPSLALKGKYFVVGFYSFYPLSRGRVHIMSADDPRAPPAFEPGFLEDNGTNVHPAYSAASADLDLLVWGYKRSRELARRLPVYRGELASAHPVFAADDAAGVEAPGPVPMNSKRGPVPIDAPDIVYSAEDDAIIERWARRAVTTTWHSLGTCAMKARSDGGVVDARLNVYGVKGLKVADLSIPPSNVGANTCSTALVIGERAAVIIGEELGIEV